MLTIQGPVKKAFSELKNGLSVAASACANESILFLLFTFIFHTFSFLLKEIYITII